MFSQWAKGEYTISTDRSLIDVNMVHDFLVRHSYWAQDRQFEITQKTIDNSLCFGLYDGADRQIGFARTITDYATFAYIADLFVLPPHRRRGLGKWLVQCILECPTLSMVRTWELRTVDAHGLYSRFGFTPAPKPENIMVLKGTPLLAARFHEFALAVET